MRGQQALEYMIIVGATMAVVLVATTFYYSFSQTKSARATAEQVHFAGQDIVATAKETFLRGTGARETLDVKIPKGVRRIHVIKGIPSELVITYETKLGISEAIFFSDVNITTDLTANGDNNVTNILQGNVAMQFNALTEDVHVRVIGET